MMRRLAVLPLAIAFACIQAGSGLAGMNPDTGPGCGLGKMLWGDFKRQKNILPQVLMGTTNWLPLPTQPFAISSGTSGCTNDRKVWAEEKATVFAQLSFDDLSQEMAQGQGEHLASLATLMGVPEEHQADLFAMAQERYLTLIESGDGSPAAMVKALHEAIAQHPVLVKVATSR